MSAMLPSDIIPRVSSSSNIVVAGFLVTATNLLWDQLLICELRNFQSMGVR